MDLHGTISCVDAFELLAEALTGVGDDRRMLMGPRLSDMARHRAKCHPYEHPIRFSRPPPDVSWSEWMVRLRISRMRSALKVNL